MIRLPAFPTLQPSPRDVQESHSVLHPIENDASPIQPAKSLPPSFHQTKSTASSEHRSCSIPIHVKGIRRTPSELQLLDDEEYADHRDYALFARIVDGIAQQQSNDYWIRQETNETLRHIIQTRQHKAVEASPRPLSLHRPKAMTLRDLTASQASGSSNGLLEEEDNKEEGIFDLDL